MTRWIDRQGRIQDLSEGGGQDFLGTKNYFLKSKYLLSPYRDYFNCTKLFTYI